MNNPQTPQPFHEQQQAVRDAGQTMKNRLLEQMQNREQRSQQDYADNVRVLADTVQAQVSDFAEALSQSIQQQVAEFVSEAQALNNRRNRK